jgi:hypothetical protein
VVSQWRSHVLAGSPAPLKPIYKTVQLYGLKDVNPTCDGIWHMQACTTHSESSISLHGLQKIYYQVMLPDVPPS